MITSNGENFYNLDNYIYGSKFYGSSGEQRNLYAFQSANDFYSRLYKKLDRLIKNTLFGNTDKPEFTFFIKAVDRSSYRRISTIEEIQLYYQAKNTQRQLLEDRTGQESIEGESVWRHFSMYNQTTFKDKLLYKKFKLGKGSLSEITPLPFKKYYQEDSGTPSNEELLLKEYFDPQNTWILTVPLIGYLDFDGLIHIVSKDSALKSLGPMNIKDLIFNITKKYDHRLYKDSKAEDNNKKRSIAEFELLIKNPDFLNEKKKQSPILDELGYLEYYRIRYKKTRSTSLSNIHLPSKDIFPLVDHSKFYDLLSSRLHAQVDNIIFQGDNKFTIFIYGLDREKENTIPHKEPWPLIYAGIERQKRLLRNHNPAIHRDEIWQPLRDANFYNSDLPLIKQYFDLFFDGKFSLNSISPDASIDNYFTRQKSIEFPLASIEEEVIRHYFEDYENTRVLILPIIGFGELNGMASIFFTKKSSTKSISKPTRFALTRSFMQEFEEAFLNWDIAGESQSKDQYLEARVALLTTQYIDPNPIFKDLKCLDYYRSHYYYLNSLVTRRHEIRKPVYEQYIKNSVTAILLDSYSHNVSAHSLSTLAWWIQLRAQRLKKNLVDWESVLLQQRNIFNNDPDKLQIIDALGEILIDPNSKSENSEGEPIVRYPGSLSRELTTLLRFLTEKGAYWSGIIRDTNNGGRVIPLYRILWDDFINNPLYLGTIAKSEDIAFIKLKIVFYEKDEDKKTKKPDGKPVTTRRKKIYLQGIFASVNLNNPDFNFGSDDSQDPNDIPLSAFVRRGDEFADLRDELKKVYAFFPGGIVGKHAFLTMLENELRNVKHYPRHVQEYLQQHGLTLVMGIQETSDSPETSDKMYQITIWLDIETELLEAGYEHLANKKWRLLTGPIFDLNHTPRLGGTSQDKICAGFLLNASFSSVQRGDTKYVEKKDNSRDKSFDTARDEDFYPWCWPLVSDSIEPNNGQGNFLKEHIDYDHTKDIELLPKRGYLKKVFYLWKGATLTDYEPQINESEYCWDNPSRYSITLLPENTEGSLQNMRHTTGVIRALVGQIDKTRGLDEQYFAAYAKWLKSFIIKKVPDTDISFYDITKGGQLLFRLVLDWRGDNELPSLYYFKKEEAKDCLPKETLKKFNNFFSEIALPFQHGPDIKEGQEKNIEIRYRSHGYFASSVLSAIRNVSPVNDITMLELFEVLATRVCIFDTRIQQRLRLEQKNEDIKKFLREKMQLVINEEQVMLDRDLPDQEAWLSHLPEEEQSFVKNCNFLVMHLSFIENILKERGINVSSGPNSSSHISVFISRFLKEMLRDNFFLVITTGRGRNDWWESLRQEMKNNNYARFVLFRPIEDFTASVELSISMEDDIELKYRLTKLLFGS